MQSGGIGKAQVIPQSFRLNFKVYVGNTCASEGFGRECLICLNTQAVITLTIQISNFGNRIIIL
jgi:hypothetical protein